VCFSAALCLCLWSVSGCRVAVNVVIRLSSHPTASPRFFFHLSPFWFDVTQLSQTSIAEKLLVCLFDLLVYLLSFLSAHSTWQKIRNKKKKQANGVGLVVVEAETTPVSVEEPAQHHQPWPPLWRLWRTIPKIFLLLFSIDCQKVFSVMCVCVVFWASELCVCAIGNL
jgi:hypothetical protein